jgi:hypothetical protein
VVDKRRCKRERFLDGLREEECGSVISDGHSTAHRRRDLGDEGAACGVGVEANPWAGSAVEQVFKLLRRAGRGGYLQATMFHVKGSDRLVPRGVLKVGVILAVAVEIFRLRLGSRRQWTELMRVILPDLDLPSWNPHLVPVACTSALSRAPIDRQIGSCGRLEEPIGDVGTMRTGVRLRHERRHHPESGEAQRHSCRPPASLPKLGASIPGDLGPSCQPDSAKAARIKLHGLRLMSQSGLRAAEQHRSLVKGEDLVERIRNVPPVASI